jgi:hypothetical protein
MPTKRTQTSRGKKSLGKKKTTKKKTPSTKTKAKKTRGPVPIEESNTKYPENARELLDDDIKSDLLEFHEGIWTGRFQHTVALGPKFGDDKKDTEAYIDQIHEWYAKRFAKTVLFLAGKDIGHKDYQLLIKNAKLKLKMN